MSEEKNNPKWPTADRSKARQQAIAVQMLNHAQNLGGEKGKAYLQEQVSKKKDVEKAAAESALGKYNPDDRGANKAGKTVHTK